jgi:hypothetical protein
VSCALLSQSAGDVAQATEIVSCQLCLEGALEAALLERTFPAVCLLVDVGAAARLLAGRVSDDAALRRSNDAEEFALVGRGAAANAGALRNWACADGGGGQFVSSSEAS